jgi:hypothetical protein
MSEETFDEKYMKTILEMIQHLKDSKLRSIGLTVFPIKGDDWEFKLEKILDKFSEEHPYCKRECDACNYGTHSQCNDPKICHDTDDKIHWVDLD